MIEGRKGEKEVGREGGGNLYNEGLIVVLCL